MHADATPGNAADGNSGSSDEQLAYKVPHAAKVLDLGERTVWSLVHSGEIESIKIGNARRIPRDALVDYVQKLRGAA